VCGLTQVVLGDDCELGAGVHIYGRSTLGARNTLGAGAVVGSNDPGSTVLGAGNRLGHYALVGVKCQVRRSPRSAAESVCVCVCVREREREREELSLVAAEGIT
jgi:acetyltransferase-like isoleucine patch superfamily enzyme